MPRTGRPSIEYTAWCNMKARCYQVNKPDYKNYGGRGIKVCERWLISFKNFLEDMGKRPAGDYSIERANTNGDYEPTNCSWATRVEQQLNRRIFIKNKLGFRGVCWHKAGKKWIAQIQLNKKHIYLGSFDMPEEAAKAYDLAAIKLHGNMAHLNFPRSNYPDVLP